ncbi:MAG: hypothetical protein JW881_14720 [Spirochaetales bacterium]|nr:hypothetical protein [Spirochaetales bacterium]
MKNSTLCVIALAVLFSTAPISGQTPEKIEQFIYSIHAFDGHSYKKTFCREASDTIYFLAGEDNFLSTRKTFIYYWPLSDTWRLDTNILNYPIKGTLHITGDNIRPEAYETVLYIYTDMPASRAENRSPILHAGADTTDAFSNTLRVLKGEEAVSEYARYLSIMERYDREVEAWQQREREYQEWKRNMDSKIRLARKEGKDVSGLVEEVQSYQFEYPPSRPSYQISPPQEAFIINLPEGDYRMKLVDPENNIIEGSEKTLKVFTKKRGNSVQYMYAAGSKLTRHKITQIAGSVIYVDGSYDLFFRPSYQNEVNELFHEKLMVNDAKGNPGKTKWIRTKEITTAWIEKSVNNGPYGIVLQDYFYADQDPEAPLGYRLVYWDSRPEAPHEYLSPSLRAFRIPIDGRTRLIDIRLRDISGRLIDTSTRRIRLVNKHSPHLLILLLCLLPLAGMTAITIQRMALYAGKKQNTD